MMSTQLPVGMKVDAEIHFVDQAGNPTSPPGPITWSSSSPTVAAVTPKNGGEHATITAGMLGSAMISAASGAISESISVTVVAGAAASATITIGDPYSRR